MADILVNQSKKYWHVVLNISQTIQLDSPNNTRSNAKHVQKKDA